MTYNVFGGTLDLALSIYPNLNPNLNPKLTSVLLHLNSGSWEKCLPETSGGLCPNPAATGDGGNQVVNLRTD